MFDGAWIGQLIAAAFYLGVGLRLARLARRTGERPEWFLSNLFVFNAISYFFYIVPLVVPIEAIWTPFNFAGRVAYIPAPVFVALFTREVFRGESRLSSFFVYATSVMLVVGIAGSAWMGDWEGFSIQNSIFWVEWTGYTFPFAWAGLEAFGQYRQARRRQRLGLCDAVVCNRLLLWGLFGLSQVLFSVMLVQMYADFEANGHFSAVFDILSGAIEIVSVALIWLVFFPPRFYRRFIADLSAEAGEAEEG